MIWWLDMSNHHPALSILLRLLTVLVLWEDNSPIHRARGLFGSLVNNTLNRERPTCASQPTRTTRNCIRFNDLHYAGGFCWSSLSRAFSKHTVSICCHK